jgi:hypothetical protein
MFEGTQYNASFNYGIFIYTINIGCSLKTTNKRYLLE